MNTILVGIPVLKDARRFHIERGQRWTVVEHILLEALAKRDWTLTELVTSSNLPRRVVIEVLIRLMRVGWAELTASKGFLRFRATAVGRAIATRETLPPVTSPDARFMSYVVELVTGTIYRARDLPPTIKYDQWRERTEGFAAAQISTPDNLFDFRPDYSILADRLLKPDEELTRVDVHDYKPQSRLIVVSVRGNEIDGIGSDLSKEFQAAILEAAKSAAPAGKSQTKIVLKPASPLSQRIHKPNPIRRFSEDLIVGAEAHKKALEEAIKYCRQRLIIHSTFIDFEKSRQFLSHLNAPLQRGVTVDILWGQSRDEPEANTSLQAALKLRKLIRESGAEDRIRIHTNSTRSHAKVLLFDQGKPWHYSAIVGSSNWLSTSFNSFEASMRLRDNSAVSDVAFELADLCIPRDGQFTDLVSELIQLGRGLARQPTSESSSSGTAQIISGSDHAAKLLEARDNAKERIVILSHRMGVSLKPTVAALIAAAKNCGLTSEIYYGRTSFPVSGESAAAETRQLKPEGIDILAVRKPRVHAKVLVWDNDDVVITSLNWLSADPSDHSPHQEIGVHVHQSGIGRRFVEAFAVAREFAD